jgi:hypothetical protein
MRQRLALVGEQENDIAGLSRGFAQFEPQTDTIDLVGDLSPSQRVPRPSEAKSPFCRRILESCEREISMPSLAAISSARRGSAILSAASAFSGAGPRATLAFAAAALPLSDEHKVRLNGIAKMR